MSDTELARFTSNRGTYIIEHIILAILGAALMTGYLVLTEDPSPWVGIIGAIIAISIRGFYLVSEQLGYVWVLTARNLSLPNGNVIPLGDVKAVRGIFSAVQVITTAGDKHLIKYQSDRAGVIKTIATACNLPIK